VSIFCKSVKDAHEEVMHWKRNCFLLPSGRVGKDFALELARLFQSYADNSTLHSIALTACSVFQILLLQKPHARSKSKDHVTCLKRRLTLWHSGDIASIVGEGKCIQDHLATALSQRFNSTNIARKFDCLMSMGKSFSSSQANS